MFRRLLTTFIISLGLIVLADGCQAPGSSDEVVTPDRVTDLSSSKTIELTPSEVTQNFYNWYLDYIGDRDDSTLRNPLVDGAYRDSNYLSIGFIAQVDETLVSFGETGFDPILQAQDIPERIEVQKSDIKNEAATVDLLRFWAGNPIPSPMTVRLCKENGHWCIDDVATPVILQSKPVESSNPAEIVQDFYADYLEAYGSFHTRLEHNPLVDGSYRSSRNLAQALVAEVNEHAANFDPYWFDPILLATNIPNQFTVEVPEISGDQATVVVLRTWPGVDTWLPMKVYLRQIDGHWQIVDLSVIMEPGSGSSSAAVEVVEAFYTWLLSYSGSPASDNFRNPLLDGAYRESPYLTPGFIQSIDEFIASSKEEYGFAPYNPFFCAQDIPMSFFTDGTFVQPANNGPTRVASTLLRTSFLNHMVLVDLEYVGDQWQISQIHCDSSPTSRAKAFYTWYLGYVSNRASGDFHSPLGKGAYWMSGFLSVSFARQVDDALASFEGGGFDPFILAQDLPQDFTVKPGPAEDSVIVHFTFFGPEDEPYGGWDALLTFVDERGRWLIDSIERIEPASTGEATNKNDLIDGRILQPA